MDVIEINAITGKVTERDFTTDEVAQRKIDAANAKDQAKTKEDADSQRLATITAARAHAASLGFTDAMLAVMYPQLEEAPSE